MGTVFSEAGQKRMTQAVKHVADLEKQWHHDGHPKVPRPAHQAASGQHVPVAEPYEIGGIDDVPKGPGRALG